MVVTTSGDSKIERVVKLNTELVVPLSKKWMPFLGLYSQNDVRCQIFEGFNKALFNFTIALVPVREANIMGIFPGSNALQVQQDIDEYRTFVLLAFLENVWTLVEEFFRLSSIPLGYEGPDKISKIINFVLVKAEKSDLSPIFDVFRTVRNMKHNNGVPSYSFNVDWKGRSYTFSKGEAVEFEDSVLFDVLTADLFRALDDLLSTPKIRELPLLARNIKQKSSSLL